MILCSTSATNFNLYHEEKESTKGVAMLVIGHTKQTTENTLIFTIIQDGNKIK